MKISANFLSLSLASHEVLLLLSFISFGFLSHESKDWIKRQTDRHVRVQKSGFVIENVCLTLSSKARFKQWNFLEQPTLTACTVPTYIAPIGINISCAWWKPCIICTFRWDQPRASCKEAELRHRLLHTRGYLIPRLRNSSLLLSKSSSYPGFSGLSRDRASCIWRRSLCTCGRCTRWPRSSSTCHHPRRPSPNIGWKSRWGGEIILLSSKKRRRKSSCKATRSRKCRPPRSCVWEAIRGICRNWGQFRVLNLHRGRRCNAIRGHHWAPRWSQRWIRRPGWTRSFRSDLSHTPCIRRLGVARTDACDWGTPGDVHRDP